MFNLHMSSNGNELRSKWSFLLPQEWVEVEVVSSKLIERMCNLPLATGGWQQGERMGCGALVSKTTVG